MALQSRLKYYLKYLALVLLIPGLLLFSTTIALITTSLTATPSLAQESPFQAIQSLLTEVPQPEAEPLVAQRVRPLELWRQVYEQLPDLPREDQYISSETGQRVTSSTLMSRFIRYHTFVRGRSPNYRFDWKLTLADYLGVNELIRSVGYPGYDSLTENPLRNDVAAIGRLNRAQRAALVDVLVTLFTSPVTTPSVPTPNAVPTPRPSIAPTPRPTVPPPVQQPRPGDAQLLQL